MDKIAKIRIFLTKALIFFVPLFFLPYTTDVFDFNKQNLFWIIVPVIALIRAVELYKGGAPLARKNIFDILLAVYVFFALASSLMGLNTNTSIFGPLGIPGYSFLNIMNFAAFYYIISSAVHEKEAVKKYLDVLLYSFTVMSVLALLNLMGLFANLAWAGIPFEKLLFFTGGESILAFTAVMLVLLTGMVLYSNLDEYRVKIFHLAAWLIALALLVLGQNQSAFVAAIVGVLCLSLFYYLDLSAASSSRLKFFIPIVFILAVLSGYLVSEMQIFEKPEPLTIIEQPALEYGESWTLAKSALSKAPLLGNGPGSFGLIFSRIRPESMNYSENWDYRFDSLSSQAMEIFSGQGIIGGLLYIALLAIFLIQYVIFIRKNRRDIPTEDKFVIFPLFAAAISLIFIQVLFGVSFIINFVFWLFLGILYYYQKEDTASLPGGQTVNEKRTGKLSGIFRQASLFLVVLCFAGWIYLGLSAARYWVADMFYRAGKESDAITVMQAIVLNPNRSEYSLRLSKLLFEQAQNELAAGVRQDEVALKETIDQAIGWAEQAADKSINDVAARENLGMIYRDLAPYVDNSESIALIHFKKAWEMEPSNPVLAMEIGKLYLKEGRPDEAVFALEKSLALKSDYFEAKFYLSKAYGQLGKESESLALLTELAGRYNDPEIYFEIGRIKYNQKKIEEAKDYFRRVLAIIPNHANSLYSLGLCYQSEGDSEEALFYFYKVLELNPDNQELITRIKQLEE